MERMIPVERLARDHAQLDNAKRDVARFKPLTEKEFVSRQQFDQVSTTAATMDANMKVGVISLKTGNAVKANDTISLVLINQMKPIYVSYSVPQRELPGIRAALNAGKVPVAAILPNDPAGPVNGRLDVIDNQIDATTGTISLKAVFENSNERLWPGEFVNVQTTLRTDPNAVVAPASAIQVGQDGRFCYVIKDDNTAEYRQVTVSRTIEGRSVIEKGLAEGERVVIDGQLRLTNGVKVDIRTGTQQGQKAERSS